MPMDNSTVKRNILNIRESLGLSQEKMADRLDICRNTYRNIEKGSTKLISDAIPKIAELCGKSPEEIVLGYISRSRRMEGFSRKKGRECS